MGNSQNGFQRLRSGAQKVKELQNDKKTYTMIMGAICILYLFLLVALSVASDTASEQYIKHGLDVAIVILSLIPPVVSLIAAIWYFFYVVHTLCTKPKGMRTGEYKDNKARVDFLKVSSFFFVVAGAVACILLTFLYAPRGSLYTMEDSGGRCKQLWGFFGSGFLLAFVYLSLFPPSNDIYEVTDRSHKRPKKQTDAIYIILISVSIIALIYSGVMLILAGTDDNYQEIGDCSVGRSYGNLLERSFDIQAEFMGVRVFNIITIIMVVFLLLLEVISIVWFKLTNISVVSHPERILSMFLYAVSNVWSIFYFFAFVLNFEVFDDMNTAARFGHLAVLNMSLMVTVILWHVPLAPMVNKDDEHQLEAISVKNNGTSV